MDLLGTYKDVLNDPVIHLAYVCSRTKTTDFHSVDKPNLSD